MEIMEIIEFIVAEAVSACVLHGAGGRSYRRPTRVVTD